MIKEPIQLEPKFYELSDEIIKVLKANELLEKSKLVLGICGESGSGKTVTAQCLKERLELQNIKVLILNMDSYFLLPPKDNHLKRKMDISWVGVGEVNLELMSSHISDFKNEKKSFKLPIVDYLKNEFTEKEIDIQTVQVIVIEGVYTFHVNELDFRIFLEADYHDTIETRKARTREVYDPFVEKVLEIEHQIALNQKKQANIVIDKMYKIV